MPRNYLNLAILLLSGILLPVVLLIIILPGIVLLPAIGAETKDHILIAETFNEALSHGQKALSENNYEEAINEFTQAKNMAPSGLNDALINLARIYATLKRYPEAESEYKQIIVVSNNSSFKSEYAQLLVDEGKFSDAQSVWGDILASNPHDKTALFNTALCLEATDSFASAIDVYKQVITNFPDSKEALEAKGHLARLNSAENATQANAFFPVDPDFGAIGFGWWSLKKMPIHVYVDDGTGVPGYHSSLKSCIYSALDAWHKASRGNISFVLDPPNQSGEQAWKQAIGIMSPLKNISEDPSSIPADPIQTGIHVHWTDNLENVAVGLAWTNVFGNNAIKNKERISEITCAHLWLHTDCLSDGTQLPVITGANQSLLEAQNRMLQEVALHELGHVLGLPHSPNPKNIMCAGIFALNSKDRVDTRSLAVGDIRSLAEHYNQFEGTGMQEENLSSSNAPAQGTRYTNKQKNTQKLNLKNQTLSKVTASQGFNDIMADINAEKYDDSLSKLNTIILQDPTNLQALYLRGVTFVMLHKYMQAKTDYQTIINLAPNSSIAKLAIAGLEKIRK